MSEQNDLFSISVLAQATGVNSITLRAWERRYGLLKPKRNDKGHRLYSLGDVEHVERVLSLIEQGVSVGKVKSLLALQQGDESIANEAQAVWPDYLEQMLAAAAQYNLNKIDSLYDEVTSLYPIAIVSTRLFLPLLKTYQARMLANYLGAIAQEHLLANYIRNRLGAHFQQMSQLAKGHVLVFTTLSSERHDFILLLFAIHCLNAGFKVISLGTNTPIEQTVFAAKKLSAKAIVYFGAFNKHEEKQLAKYSYPTSFNFAGESSTELIGLSHDFSAATRHMRAVLATEVKNDG